MAKRSQIRNGRYVGPSRQYSGRSGSAAYSPGLFRSGWSPTFSTQRTTRIRTGATSSKVVSNRSRPRQPRSRGY